MDMQATVIACSGFEGEGYVLPSISLNTRQRTDFSGLFHNGTVAASGGELCDAGVLARSAYAGFVDFEKLSEHGSQLENDETQAASSLLEQLSNNSPRASQGDAVSSTTMFDDERGGVATSLQPGQRYSMTSTSSASASQRRGPGRKFYIEKSVDGTCYKVLDEMTYQMTAMNEERNRLAASAVEAKIPRPPNAFMIYANEYRRVLATEFPRESNKEISVRLGTLWKHMEKPMKDKYFHLSRVVDAEHKKRYPNYVYNPKEARMRKAIRDQTREQNRLYSGKTASPTKRAHNGMALQSGDSPQSRRMVESSKSKMSAGGPTGYHHQQWPGEGLNPYGGGGGNEGYVETPYQPHDGGVYANVINGQASQWYPYGMQQYAHAWPQHPAAAGYAAQRMQYAQMQHGGPQPQPQPSFPHYEQAEAHAQQQLQGGSAAKIPKRAENPEPANQNASSAASSSFQDQQNPNPAPSTNSFPRQATPAAAAADASSMPQQETGSTTPQSSPTKAYHKYLQDSGLSSPSWPFMPNPNMMGHDKPGFNYFNDNMHQFTYYDYGMMPGCEFLPSPHMVGMPYGVPPTHPFNTQTGKAEEYARALHQTRSTNIQPCEDSTRKIERAKPSKALKPSDKPSKPVDEYSTMTLNVMTAQAAKQNGGRVIATYETQGDGTSKGRREERDEGNETFSFMQDPSLKNMLTSIDDGDGQKIIQQNKNVCVISNDAYAERSDFGAVSSDNSLDSP